MDVSGIPLNPELIRGYIMEVLADSSPRKNEAIREEVEALHASRGGQPSLAQDSRSQFTKALRIFKQNGQLDNPTEGYWRLIGAPPPAPVFAEAEPEAEIAEDAEVTIGDGPESVYGWYLPAYRKLAEMEGSYHWPIKVGRTARPPGQRIEESWGMLPERPRLGFRFRCSEAGNWERFFHSRLTLSGRHLGSAIGREWFNTNLDELAGIATEGSTPIKCPKREDDE